MSKKTRLSQYWAAAPREHIASEINSKFDAYLKWLSESGQADKMQTSYNLCYGEGHEGRGTHAIEQEGDDGVISRMTVPHYANLLERIHGLVTQAKLSFQPKAVNSDAQSQLTADFARGLLAYETDRGLSKITAKAVDNALKLFDGYIYAPWNPNAGEKVRPGADGRMVFAGDQEYYVLNAFECARSWQTEETPWYICETKANRWDLIATYPEHQQDLLNATSDRTGAYTYLQSSLSDNGEVYDEDVVITRTLLHKPTKALPRGRIATVVGNTVLEYRDFDYAELPVVRMTAGNILGSTAGTSPAANLISLQLVLDKIYSAKATNVLNGCLSNIYTKDPNLSIESIGRGKNLIVASELPVAVALTGNSPDTNELINDVINQQTLLSGVNNTARGNPETSLKSGTSLALMLSTAIQFISPIQLQYSQATADLATIIVHNLQRFCKVERLAYIAGAAGKETVRAFTGQDLMGIDRISVELGNPLTQSTAGRMEMVQLLLQNGAIKDPTKIDDFLRTGSWESLTEDAFAENTLIREENETLRKGQSVVVVMTDNHPRHIQEHLKVLYSTDARSNPQIVAAVLAHVNSHKDEMKAMDPDLAAMLGIPPLPSQQQPAPPPGAGNGPQSDAPDVMGANLPPMPEGTPGQFAAPYNDFSQQVAANPTSQPME